MLHPLIGYKEFTGIQILLCSDSFYRGACEKDKFSGCIIPVTFDQPEALIKAAED